MSATQITVHIENETPETAVIQILTPPDAPVTDEISVPGEAGGKVGRARVDVAPGTYIAKVIASPIPGLQGKVSAPPCDVQPLPNVLWKIVVSSAGVTFSGSQNDKN